MEPTAALRVDQNTHQFYDQSLSEVTLWAAPAPKGFRHWITSFHFAQSKRVGNASYEGVSVSMEQPKTHERHNPQRDGPENFYGSLHVMPRVQGVLYSRQKGMFRCSLALKERDVTVQEVVGLMTKQEMQFYKFNEEQGSGCLFWQFRLLEEMVGKGWIGRADLDTAYSRVKGLAEAANDKTGRVPWPAVEGTFYKPEEMVGNGWIGRGDPLDKPQARKPGRDVVQGPPCLNTSPARPAHAHHEPAPKSEADQPRPEERADVHDIRREVRRPVEVREAREDGAAAVEEARRAHEAAERREASRFRSGVKAILDGGSWEVGLLEALVRGGEVEESAVTIGADKDQFQVGGEFAEVGEARVPYAVAAHGVGRGGPEAEGAEIREGGEEVREHRDDGGAVVHHPFESECADVL